MPYLNVDLRLSGIVSIVDIADIVISRKETNKMANLTSIPPGGTGTFVATLFDQLGNPAQLPTGVVPAWTLSNTAVGSIAPSTADPTGLTAIATLAVAAVAGTSFNVVMTVTMPDGTTPSGLLAQTVASLEVASVTITRTA